MSRLGNVTGLAQRWRRCCAVAVVSGSGINLLHAEPEGGSSAHGFAVTATDRDCPSFCSPIYRTRTGARSRLVMKVAVAADGVRIGWTKRVAAATEAGSSWVRSAHDYLVRSPSGFIRTGRARAARCQRQGGPARGMA